MTLKICKFQLNPAVVTEIQTWICKTKTNEEVSFIFLTILQLLSTNLKKKCFCYNIYKLYIRFSSCVHQCHMASVLGDQHGVGGGETEVAQQNVILFRNTVHLKIRKFTEQRCGNPRLDLSGAGYSTGELIS